MTQLSTVEENWQTKLSRVMLKSRNNPELVFNNLGHIIDMEMLHSCYASLDGNKAAGIDKVTKEKYGRKLFDNLGKLLNKIKRGSFIPQPSRLVEIPKADGGKRPLAICCFEDKIVQEAVRRVLHSIYEPHFFDFSYGFRPQKNCHMALQCLRKQLMKSDTGAVLDVDIKQCFNSICHEKLVAILKNKIGDIKFLNLITKLIRSENIDNLGEIHVNAVGTPQGSILSPTLCNIFLHEVVDKWFIEINAREFFSSCTIVRYADDMVFTTVGIKLAEKLQILLSSRLEMFGLEIHPDKTKIIRSGKKLALKAIQSNEKFPLFDFLGFTHFWGISINNKTKEKFARIKLITSAKRLRNSLKLMDEYIRNNRHSPLLMIGVKRKMVGYLNYYSINDNQRRISQFVYIVSRMLFKWLNRRSQKRSVNWVKLTQILERLKFPKPIIQHDLFFNMNNYGKT